MGKPCDSSWIFNNFLEKRILFNFPDIFPGKFRDRNFGGNMPQFMRNTVKEKVGKTTWKFPHEMKAPDEEGESTRN